MKALLILCFLMINQSNLKLSSKSDYDYSSYKANITNQSLEEQIVTSLNIDESVVYITDTSEEFDIRDSTIRKISGNSSDFNKSELYGVNAAILVQGGTLSFKRGIIETEANGAYALVATNEASVSIKDATINSTADVSAKGLHTTFGGSIKASRMNIYTYGEYSPDISSEKEGQIISCKDCTLSTKGKGSPLVNSAGDITLKNSDGFAEGAQIAVIKGTNTFEIEGLESEFKCSASPSIGEIDQCGFMIYQSTYEDSTGTVTFKCQDSNMEIIDTSPYYQTAPMFFITNTNAFILLERNEFKFGSNIFLSVKGTDIWGEKEKNGGNVTLTLKGQNIEGDFVVDNISYLTLILKDSSIIGTINPDKMAKKLVIYLRHGSKITLKGNSYYTEFYNDERDGSNLINGSFTWTKYNDNSNSNNSVNYCYNANLILLIISIILL